MDKTVSYSFIQFLFQLVCFFLSVKLMWPNDKAKVDDLITCIRWKNILIWQADCEPVAEFSLKPGVSERLWSKKWVCVGSWIGQRKSPVIVLWCFLMFFFCVLVCRLHLFGTGKVTFVEEVLPCLILGAAKRKDVIFCRVPCLSMLFW